MERMTHLAYKGGRNESFAYGVLSKTKVYDYDLINAYTTALATMGVPDWDRAREIKYIKDLHNYTTDDALRGGYLICEFEYAYPEGVMHTHFPSLIDTENWAYTLRGTSICGGYEIQEGLKAGARITRIQGG